MANTLRLFGNELSPYSVKVRSYFRFKRIPHEWLVRNPSNEEEFQTYAKLPLIPLVVTPEGQGYQDSTPIIEHFETVHPEPSIHPPDPALNFLSALIEEYADEWCNKPMFHYRWWYEADQASAAERLAASMMPDADRQGAMEMIKGRMIPRLKLVGSCAETKEQIEASFERQLGILSPHLAPRKYLFGDRPAFADFALFAQLHQCSTDPTPFAIMRTAAPSVLRWIHSMLDPSVEGDWEEWDTLESTLLPIFGDEIGPVFLPWAAANAAAVAAGHKQFSMTLDGKPFSQDTQKYAAKSYAVLRAKYAAVADTSQLDPVLQESGCLQWLK